MLQDNFQTRALIGLFGDDQLRFSVTPDGSTFNDALSIDTAESNDQACFDAGTNLFTAPVAGTYLLGASLMYKTNGNAGARMQGRLVLNGASAISGTTSEANGAHNSETTTLPLQTLTPLSVGDTVELQGNFRSFDGYMMAGEMCFWGTKVG